MAIPNMAMIPSGYKPTKLYSVLPTPENGSEEVTNGDFSNGTNDWTIEAVWTIAGGVANGNGANGSDEELSQGAGLTVGKTYSVSYEIKNYVSGSVTTSKPSGVARSANGVYTENLTANSANLLFRGANFNGSITNVSVKEVITADADFTVTRASSATRVNEQGLIETPEFIIGGDVVVNGDFSSVGVWVTNTGWSISGGVCVGTSVPTSEAVYQTPLIIGKRYRITVDLVSVISGGIKERIGNSSNTIERTTVGTYSFERVADSTVLGIIAGSSGFTGTIDNVSVMQVEVNDIPRLDYTDGGCPVLLTEPQSTNLVPLSENISDSDWTKSGSSIDSNSTTSPRGIVDASKLVEDTSLSSHNIRFDSPNTPVTSGLKYTVSFFAKTSGRDVRISNAAETGMNVFYNLSNGTIVSSGGAEDSNSIVDYGNGWYRCIMSFTAITTIAQINIATSEGGLVTYQGNGTSGAYVWGVQLEELSYSTSYIPTYGEIATRASETVSDAGDVNTFNSEEGVLFAEIAALSDDLTNRAISLSDGTSSNRCVLRYGGTSNYINVLISSGGSFVFDDNFTLSDITDFSKIAVKWSLNSFALWVDGVERKTSSIGSAPIGLSQLQLSNFDNGATPFYGKTSQVQVFNTALSDYELELLTSGSTLYDSYEAMRLALNYNIQ